MKIWLTKGLRDKGLEIIMLEEITITTELSQGSHSPHAGDLLAVGFSTTSMTSVISLNKLMAAAVPMAAPGVGPNLLLILVTSCASLLMDMPARASWMGLR